MMSFISSENVQESVARLQAMCYQEETAYATCDFFQHHGQNIALHKLPGNVNSFDIDAESRTQMVDWCFQVIDFCKFNRETAEIAMSYVDRFMLSPNGRNALCNRSYYQLACMTALYTAVKIHEPEAMDPTLVAKLSRGLYASQEIEAMELTMLSALQWRVNPPTSASFVREFLQILPQGLFSQLETSQFDVVVNDLIRLQTDMTVRDYRYINVKTSHIAYCAFMNAMETVLGNEEKLIGYIGCILAEAIGIDCNSCAIVDIQSHLYESVVVHHTMKLMNPAVPASSSSPTPTRKGVARTNSPRSIFGF